MTSIVRSQLLVNKLQNCMVCNAEPTPSKQLTNLFVKDEVCTEPFFPLDFQIKFLFFLIRQPLHWHRRYQLS